MSLDDFYILRIQDKKKGYMDTYRKLLVEMFDKELTWTEVKNLPRENQMKLTLQLERRVKIEKSNYSISKLARAIQYSRSGIGLSAMTEFECAFCGEKEWWGSTAIPRICTKCAEKMAENIVIGNHKIEKD